MERLEAAQRRAARVITGLIKTSPNDTILMEARLQPVTDRLQSLSIKACEKALRTRADHPRHQAAATEQRQRTKRTDWTEHSRRQHVVGSG